jgi:hypothetical protein
MPWVSPAERPDQPLPDDGPAILDELFEALYVDDEWSVRDDRAFTWWPYRVPQRIEVSEPRLSFGDPTIKVTATCELVTGVTAPTETRELAVAAMNQHASMGAYVWDEERRAVRLATTAYLHPENRSLFSIVVMAVLLCANEANAKAPSLASVLQGRPGERPHPTSGARPEPDELLGFVDQVVVPTGAEPSGFVGLPPEAEEALDWCMANSSDSGFTGELPFYGDTPVATLAATGGGPVETAMVRMLTDQPHPGYGSGLLMLLMLPDTFERHDAAVLADALNRAEADELTGFPLFGAWCPAPEGSTLSFCTFLPSVIAQPGLLATLSFYELLRVGWVRAGLSEA